MGQRIDIQVLLQYFYSSFLNSPSIKPLLGSLCSAGVGIAKKVLVKICNRNSLVKGTKHKDPRKSVTNPGINNKAPPRARKKPVIIENSNYNLQADMVIKALGFDPENLPKLFGSENLQVSRWGTIKTNFDTMETNLTGVFAAGDIVRGASLVVWAIKDGRDAAKSIDNYLNSTRSKKVA